MANLFDVDNAPTSEPSEVTVGSYIQWKRADLAEDYPVADYSLIYILRLRGGTATEITITANEVNGEYVVQVPSTTSAGWTAGNYHWQAEIQRTSDSSRVLVGRGDIRIMPDLDDNGTDPRSHAEIMLDKIESLLSGRADKDVSSYSINGRSLAKMNISDLLAWRDYYRKEVAKERREANIANGKPVKTTVKVRFL
jgi:hypothetical protein